MKALAAWILLVLASLSPGEGFRLRPFDGLSIVCSDPSYSLTVAIDPTGMLEVPGLGAWVVGGMTCPEVDALLGKAALDRGEALRFETAPVALKSSRVWVSGAAAIVGPIPLNRPVPLSTLLNFVQPKAAADTERVEAVRLGEKLSELGPQTVIRPGDRVNIPGLTAPNEVYVLGGVAHPGAVPFSEGLTAAKAIELAGGLTGHGDPRQIALERGTQTLPLESPLKRGDVVRVGLFPDRLYVTIEGAIGRPGLVQFHLGMKLGEVIREAGGLSPKADGAHIEIKPIQGPTKTFDYAAVLAGKADDVALSPFDLVHIPVKREKGKN